MSSIIIETEDFWNVLYVDGVGPKGDKGDKGDPGTGLDVSWVDVTDKPTAFPPEAHTQEISTINGLQSALDGKATTAQGAKADAAVQPTDLATVATSGLYSDLTGKPFLGTAAAAATTDFAAAVHTHVSTDVTDFAAASRAQTEAALVAGTGITITPAGTGATRTLTLAASGVQSDPTGVTGADAVTNIISLTQAEYDAIPVKSATTLYAITD